MSHSSRIATPNADLLPSFIAPLMFRIAMAGGKVSFPLFLISRPDLWPLRDHDASAILR